MGNGGNKILLDIGCPAECFGHMIKGMHQFADFAVIVFGHTDRKITLRNPACCLCQFGYGMRDVFGSQERSKKKGRDKENSNRHDARQGA